jgi:tetratricopeptide (TPR) repeat protein
VRATERPAGAEAVPLDARTDLYSLGVLLYELLAGRHPFGLVPGQLPVERQRAALGEWQRRGPRPLREGNPQVDLKLQELLETCLAYRPEDRLASAEALAQELRAALSRRRRVRRWVAGHCRGAVVAALLLLAGITGAAYAVAMRAPADVRAFERGQEAYRHGRFAEAVEYFNEAHALNPASPEVPYARGRANQQREDFRAAEDDYRAALRLTADAERQARLKACLAYCSGMLGNHGQAILWYEDLERTGWQTAALLNNFGWSCLQHLGRSSDRAEPLLTRAIELAPGLQAAYFNRAEFHLRQAFKNPAYPPTDGLADIREALRLGPASAWLHFEEGKHLVLVARHRGEDDLLRAALPAFQTATEGGLDLGHIRAYLLQLKLPNAAKDVRLNNLPRLPGRASSTAVPPPRLVDPLHGLDS